MASSSLSPSAMAYSSQLWKYHVFLSFRGEDTRKTFVDHLYTALVQQGIYTYKDDETFPRGESIAPSLEKAIEESQIAVIIFSKNYADSSWCLDELVHIMKCKDMRDQIVMPIFYDVDPSEVRKQKRKYGEAFAIHELDNKTKVESWRKALLDASNLSGWEPQHIANGHESKCIKEIVDIISHRLRPITSSVDDNLIGVESRMQDLISKLQIGFGGKRMIGIWGVGGGDKTTLASSIYDEVSSRFDGCCFLKNIREESIKKNGLENMQAEILSGVLKQKLVQVGRVEEGRRMIKDRLHHRKVLIVLDDVDNLEQLEQLVGSHDWFGEGSRIIITTRDEHVLSGHRVDVIHNITLLNNDEAMKLFCKHAPQGQNPTEDYELLSKDVVSYACGLPLALRILGRFLCDKDMNEWRSALARLKEIPDANILEKLKISFDGLTPVERELFLDIACFFRGHDYKDEKMMMILDACGFHPVIGIKVLIQKALITISNKRFSMHDLVQEMAHYIVRGGHPNNPEKHSRVWKREDVLNICAMDAMENLDKIEAINYWCLRSTRESQVFLQVIANMKKLRWIDVSFGLTSTLPENFSPRELCCLIFSGGLKETQIWEGYKYLPNLRTINLDLMPNLTKTPNFDGLRNIERFMIRGCGKLIEIHPSFGHLEKLVYVVIDGCFNLQMLPPITRSKKLETLELSKCSKLFNSSRIQQKLLELPSSIAVVIADDCNSLERFGDISNCKWLWKFSLWGNNKLGPLDGDILLNTMLQGNAKDYFMSINLSNIDIWMETSVVWIDWVKTYNMQLPQNWYNHFSGILMLAKCNNRYQRFNIIIKQGVDEDFQSEFWQESNQTLESSFHDTYVGYVSFSSLRRTGYLNSTYNMISFSTGDSLLLGRAQHRFRARVVLIPKDDPMQTAAVATNCSEFWDKEVLNRKTFTIQHDSNSSIKISWFPWI